MNPCMNGCLSREHYTDCALARCVGCLPREATEGNLCGRCYTRLAEALDDLPVTYALLEHVLEPGSVQLDDGRRKRGKRADAPVPVRLDVVAYRDHRGTASVVALLESWARLVREERGLTQPTAPATVVGEASFLRTHLDWIARQDWIIDMWNEILDLNRQLTQAIGETNPKPVGDCPECGGPLWPPKTGDAIRCTSCPAQWTRDQWLWLGRVIGETA
ncbi:MAG: hypothetical protein ACRDMV_01115 [Streptosporangiales bacterium]